MTPTDCIDVVEFLATRCPAMRMHDNTPEAWYLDLVGHTRDDALEAVRRCSLNSTFVGIGDLVAECVRIRDKRIGAEKVAERQAQIERENRGELVDKPVAALTVGKDVPIARYLAQQVSAGRKPASAINTEAETQEQARRAAARAELAALTAQNATEETA